MTTKEDVRSGFESIGKFIETIGNTIKENKRKQQVEKVLSQFNNPDKIFLNADGTPKSDSEIAPMLNQGVMSLYQLGEDKLANSLTQYFGQMSKSFDQQSQNKFNYVGNMNDARFPKDENGNPIAFNERTAYPNWNPSKQYKPDAKKTYKPLVIDEGSLGKRVLYYNDEVNEWGNWDDEGNWVKGDNKYQYVKPVNVSQSSVNITSRSMNSGITQSYKDPVTGETHNVVFDNATKKFTENGKNVDVSKWTPMGENTPFPQQQDFFKTPEFNNFDGALQQAYKNKNITMADYNAAQDYITGKTTTYPERLWKLGFESQLNELRQKYLSQPK